MNKHLQTALGKLENCMAIQLDCAKSADKSNDYAADYMQGMINGMVLSHSIFCNQSPKFYSRSHTTKNNKIRHKSK